MRSYTAPFPERPERPQDLLPEDGIRPHRPPVLVDALPVVEFPRLDRPQSRRARYHGKHGDRLSKARRVTQHAAPKRPEVRVFVFRAVHRPQGRELVGEETYCSVCIFVRKKWDGAVRRGIESGRNGKMATRNRTNDGFVINSSLVSN